MTTPFDDLPSTREPLAGGHDDEPSTRLVDGDTPPHGVPPVVLPRTRARAGGRGRRDQRDAGSGRSGPGPRAGRKARAQGDGLRHYRRRRLGRRARLVLVALVVVILAVVGAVGWFESEANPSGKPGAAVIVHVHRGESANDIMAALTKEGVIGSSLAFRMWSLLNGTPSVRAGLYQLHRNLPFATVSADLSAGPNVYALNVVPGTTVAEIGNELAQLPGNLAQGFETEARTGAVHSPYQPAPGTSLEGLIGAGTYEITPGESAKTLLGRMVARFDGEAKTAGLTPATSANGQSAYGIITVASIAMKEGYFSRYFGEVARVVYNRLAYGMRLDMTSTVLYSLGQDGGPVTAQEEQETTPYNTYLHAGLTPTPICTPSEAALKAAAAPPAGSWLYFELTTAKKGVMVFSSSYTTQLRAEQEAALNAESTGSSGSGTGTGT